MSQNLLRHIEKEKFLRAGDRVGVAVSGGGDSVALLLLLVELRDALGIVLSAVHFNHKLRGKVSDADENFVAKLASTLSLDFHSASADVGQKAKIERANLEDAGRRARYEWFDRIANEQRLTHVATAHTADDQAETVLAHLLRGTGLAGLCGIHPVSGKVIRPLLGIRRRQLRAYLKQHRQTWREDTTNRDTKRTRARIRQKLIPLLEKQFQPLAVEHLASLAERAQENEALLSALCEQARRTLISATPEGQRIPVEDLLAPTKVAPQFSLRALSGRLVLQLAAQGKVRAGQLTAAHVQAVLDLAENGEPGKLLQLPGGLRVRREPDALLFFNAP